MIKTEKQKHKKTNQLPVTKKQKYKNTKTKSRLISYLCSFLIMARIIIR